MLAMSAVCTQAADAQSVRDVELRPMTGGIVFLGDVAEVSAENQERGARSSLENGIAYGMDIGVPLAEQFGVDVKLRYAPTDFSVHNGTQSFGFENKLYMGGAGVSYTPDENGGSATPAFSAGLGAKYYTLFNSGTLDFMWYVGTALEVETHSVTLRFDLVDFMSTFDESGESKLQNDVMFTTAVVLSPF